VHFLLEELKIFLKSSLYTIFMSHNKSESDFEPGVGLWSPKFTLESESESHKNKDSASLI